MEPHEQKLLLMLKQRKAEDPMGAGNKQSLRVTFDSRLKLKFHGYKITSDAGLLERQKKVDGTGKYDTFVQ